MTLNKALIFLAFALALIACAIAVFSGTWKYTAALIPGALASYFLALLVAPH